MKSQSPDLFETWKYRALFWLAALVLAGVSFLVEWEAFGKAVLLAYFVTRLVVYSISKQRSGR